MSDILLCWCRIWNMFSFAILKYGYLLMPRTSPGLRWRVAGIWLGPTHLLAAASLMQNIPNKATSPASFLHHTLRYISNQPENLLELMLYYNSWDLACSCLMLLDFIRTKTTDLCKNKEEGGGRRDWWCCMEGRRQDKNY